MRRFRRLTWLVPAVAFLLIVCVAPPQAGAADLSYAGVVVRHDDSQMSYGYIGFTEPEINGIDLLRRTGLDVVTVSFGGLGEAVCSIDATGCPSSECRQRVCQGPTDADPFWQYFRQSTPGDWQALALGASSTKVHDGDVDGWSWTSHDAALPALDLDDVARLSGYDGTAFTGAPAGEPGAALQREGIEIEEETQSVAVYLAAGGFLLIAVAAVVLLTVRRRRPARSP